MTLCHREHSHPQSLTLPPPAFATAPTSPVPGAARAMLQVAPSACCGAAGAGAGGLLATPATAPGPGGACATAGTAACASPSCGGSRRVRQPRVLVVDDVAINRLVLSRMLRLLGFEVLEASDGVACLDICHRLHSTLDCVLLDLHMPVMDGWATAVEVRAWERGCLVGRGLPLLACTGECLSSRSAAGTTVAEQAFLCGMNECIAKPPSLAELRDVLAKYVPGLLPVPRPLTAAARGTLADAGRPPPSQAQATSSAERPYTAAVPATQQQRQVLPHAGGACSGAASTVSLAHGPLVCQAGGGDAYGIFSIVLMPPPASGRLPAS